MIIYGHNMKNGSMFAGLKKFREDDFYENHKNFTVYTADHVYTYEIFAVHVTSPDSDAYTIGFGEMSDFVDYVKRMQSQSLMNTGVIVGEEDHIMTLSTCVNQKQGPAGDPGKTFRKLSLKCRCIEKSACNSEENE